ncbi:MAG TPA: His-Xaa-Ser system protein HxsD [Candidatus Acidoferrales bacterium]|nr:His-Xaa-Ser system protein HxsD [Candidatus Acidoferrales bacterium]
MAQANIETIDAKTSTLRLSLDIDLYPREVLYAAAYVFLDRAYVLLDRDGQRFIVQLRAKQPLEEAALRAFAGEFENELLAQALRHKVFAANQRIIENIANLAISGAVGGDHSYEGEGFAGEEGAPLSGLHGATDDAMDFLDDPLGLAKPWEAEKKGDE